MAVPTIERRPMSLEEWEALPPRPRSEWVDGEAVIVNVAMAPRHSDVEFALRTVLSNALPDCATYHEVGVWLPGNRIRVPDVMVLRHAVLEDTATEPPIIVAEVLSRITATIDLIEKAPEYAAAGIPQYWVIDPDDRILRIYRLVAGEWERSLHLDDSCPQGSIEVGEYGVVPLDLAELLGE